MVARLLSLLSTAKGAAAAGLIAAAAATTGVVATNSDVQNALGDAAQNLAGPHASPSGRPAVVASRNDADQKLRSAFQDDQQKLEKLRSTQVSPSDRGKLDALVSDADAKLRARLTKALDDVAALTLGREGLEASGSPKPSASPEAKPSGSPDVRITFTADAQAKVDDIVKTAIADMDKITNDATSAVAALPTSQPGKPSDAGGGAPSTRPTPPTSPGRP